MRVTKLGTTERLASVVHHHGRHHRGNACQLHRVLACRHHRWHACLAWNGSSIREPGNSAKGWWKCARVIMPMFVEAEWVWHSVGLDLGWRHEGLLLGPSAFYRGRHRGIGLLAPGRSNGDVHRNLLSFDTVHSVAVHPVAGHPHVDASVVCDDSCCGAFVCPILRVAAVAQGVPRNQLQEGDEYDEEVETTNNVRNGPVLRATWCGIVCVKSADVEHQPIEQSGHMGRERVDLKR
mmetsp:Transcript_39695/g.81296  ORF Transcript_39695/g.81296 Transcript_39695/m.81296 type:complete len:236 (-) Transcript_39695:411-1118(-)